MAKKQKLTITSSFPYKLDPIFLERERKTIEKEREKEGVREREKEIVCV